MFCVGLGLAEEAEHAFGVSQSHISAGRARRIGAKARRWKSDIRNKIPLHRWKPQFLAPYFTRAAVAQHQFCRAPHLCVAGEPHRTMDWKICRPFFEFPEPSTL
jgi:hypothetical protein